MIRITAGEWRGRRIRTPSGQDTRPSPSRVREAVFNILGPLGEEAVFLDLYAGSGAMGLEALSRGAPQAVFYESSRKAMEVLRKNIRDLGCRDRTETVSDPIPPALVGGRLRLEGAAVAFLDPPYRRDLAPPTLQALADAWPAVPAGGDPSVAIAQTERNAPMAERYGGWRLQKSYRHGDTQLWLYELP
ncbi:MAG: 16S rRNA (guanine(966)-N(2))-methyltransferase RsmD [Candidatus Sumerlaeota bacterium]